MARKRSPGKTAPRGKQSPGTKQRGAGEPDVPLKKPGAIAAQAAEDPTAAAGSELEPGDAQSHLPFPVVALGASAGGLDAFTRIIQHLPIDTGMAFVLIQHLAPLHESMLAPLLSRVTTMPVEEVRNGMRVEVNHIYVIPPNKRMRISGGVLSLEPRRNASGPAKPIDLFFSSLAESQQSRAIGVVLSGSDNDGALGLRAIKAQGGIVLAQDDESAAFKEMPRNAIATGQVDLVLSPEGIASQLTRIGRDPYVSERQAQTEGTSDPAWLTYRNRIFAVLRNATGVDFQHYKISTVRRRLHRRMVINRCESVEPYLAILETNPSEVKALHDDLLINVTDFFRDPDVYQAIQENLLPRLISSQTAGSAIRIWVPGCSSGEEAYSLAICVLEHLERNAISAPVQIFGTDANESLVARARAAVYPNEQVLRLHPDRIRRFFVKLERGYQIEARVRECCVFARHNLLTDPPFSRIDLVSCRNVLIYLQSAIHRRVISAFNYSLKPSGILILGKSESVLGSGEDFAPLDKQKKIFVKPAGSPPQGLVPPLERIYTQPPPTAPAAGGGAQDWGTQSLQQAVNRLIAARHGPPGVVVDSRLEVVQSHGDISRFLQINSGAASLSILKLAPASLRTDLRDLLGKVIRENAARSCEGQLKMDGQLRAVRLAAYPVPAAEGKDPRFLLLFQLPGADGDAAEPALLLEETDRALAPPTEAPSRDSAEALLHERDAALQELTAAHEEVQSANEELQSANEELQSTNEELQTAKEELQATNEELTTLNEELQNRNLELGRLGDDLNNLLSSMTLPIVMLDNELLIRRITPAAEQVMNLRPSDIGRPLTDIRMNLIVEDLAPVLRGVLESLNTVELELQDQGGKWHLLRVRPYRTSDHRIAGLVLLLVEITQLKQAESILRNESLRLESALTEESRERALSGDHLASEKKGRSKVEGALHRSQEALDVSRARLRLLAGKLLRAQDAERSRVARELHDDLSQKLALVEFNLQRLEQKPPASQKELRGRLEAVRNQVGVFSVSLRRIAYQLHPSTLDHLGLGVALRALAADFSRREGMVVTVSCRDLPASLPREAGASLYRIAQEALSNVARHAGKGTKVSISARRCKAGLNLTIHDDGAGFDTTAMAGKPGLGLISMQERSRLLHGTFMITSKPGEGVLIRVSIPLAEEKQP